MLAFQAEFTLLIVDRGQRLALEMKARDSGTVSKEQKQWLAHLETQGWTVAVCHGAQDAIAWLREVLPGV